MLILDEPFNGMDPRQRLHMFELLRSMAEQGRTVLLSSHILEEVERVADFGARDSTRAGSLQPATSAPSAS